MYTLNYKLYAKPYILTYVFSEIKLTFGAKALFVCISLNKGCFIASGNCGFCFKGGQSTAIESEFAEKNQFQEFKFKIAHSWFLSHISLSSKWYLREPLNLVYFRTVALWKAICTTQYLFLIKSFIF
jgi:hypothetical protein